MHPNVMVSEKAWNTWLEICYAWFDYDSASHVTNKAYNLHEDINLILMYGGKPYNQFINHEQ